MNLEPTPCRRLPPAVLRNRLRWLFAMFVMLLLTVYGRLIALELRDGPEFRAIAAEPIVRRQSVPGMRGRILARDGAVLAYDEPLVDVAVNYRWLEEPPNPRWLRQMVRAQLSPAERRDTRRLAEEEQRFLAERIELWKRLASLCGLTTAQWQARTEQIQQRVEAIAAGVNARRENASAEKLRDADFDESHSDSPAGWLALVGRSIAEALFEWDDDSSSPPVTAAEELTEHVVYEGLPLDAVAEIETHPQNYPGVKLIHSYRRAYPEGNLAAHVVGYLGRPTAEEIAAAENSADAYHTDDWLGRTGIERQYESRLRGHRGLTVDQLDPRGRIVSSTTVRQPSAGSDVVLTLDPALQRTAQTLLDEALARRLPSGDEQLDAAAGAALLAIDVHTGAVLAAASSPRFDPNAFPQRDSQAVQHWLNDPARPLFDRTVQMALPPGSVFKIVSAAALLSAGIDPQAPFDCQGYLRQPDALRCAVYRRYGIGHGPVTMVDALARSCNVYFFHYAEQVGANPLLDWAQRLGLGRATGIDLPSEVAGNVPASNPASDAVDSKISQPDALMIAIGQGPITATPLQIVRMVAAIANGGNLVTPYVAERLAEPPGGNSLPTEAARQASPLDEVIRHQPPRPIQGLTVQISDVIRKGLRQTVADEQGTAYHVVNVQQVAIAGKTGTAETGGNQPEHAWFAGYAPADNPQVAFVVVMEHAGNSAPATGPVVQYLAKRMDELGYFGAEKERIADGAVPGAGPHETLK
ncbi:MAG TPA: penicillin-binding transpeptidase domain-containing protein [Pirellulales bacterium]|nr:penicillin-binding transpeptidase domain-containing protein [Pirellulales bacterium]